MKTSQIARGIVGALSLAGVIGAIGCSADAGYEGAAGDGEIGSTAEALTVDATPNTITSGFERDEVGFCIVKDSVTSTRFIVYGGGSDNSLGLSNEIFVSSNGNTYAKLSTTDASDVLHQARKNITTVSTPDELSCAFLGGVAAGGDSAEVDFLTVANNVWTVTTGTDLNVARSFARGAFCETNGNVKKFVVYGGFSGGAPLRSIEVSNNLTATAAWANNNSGSNRLAVARADFSGVQDTAQADYRIVAAGGDVGAGQNTDNIEFIKFSTACVPTATNVTAANSAVKLPSRTKGLEGFLKSGSTFVFAGGRDDAMTPVLVTTTTEATINFTTPASSSVAGSPPSITGLYHPLVALGGAKPMLLGGSNAAESASLTLVQEYNGTNWSTTASMSEGHYFGAVGVLAGVAYVPVGRILGTGLATKIEEVTPTP